MTPKSFSQHDNSNEVISRQVTYCTTFFRKIFHTWNFMRLVLGPVAFCQAHFLFRAKKKHEHFLFVFWNKTSRVNIVQTVSDRRSPNSFSFVGWLQEWDARRTVRRALWVLLADICSSLVHRSKLCWSLHIKHYLSSLFVLWFFVPFPHH